MRLALVFIALLFVASPMLARDWKWAGGDPCGASVPGYHTPPESDTIKTWKVDGVKNVNGVLTWTSLSCSTTYIVPDCIRRINILDSFRLPECDHAIVIDLWKKAIDSQQVDTVVVCHGDSFVQMASGGCKKGSAVGVGGPWTARWRNFKYLAAKRWQAEVFSDSVMVDDDSDRTVWKINFRQYNLFNFLVCNNAAWNMSTVSVLDTILKSKPEPIAVVPPPPPPIVDDSVWVKVPVDTVLMGLCRIFRYEFFSSVGGSGPTLRTYRGIASLGGRFVLTPCWWSPYFGITGKFNNCYQPDFSQAKSGVLKMAQTVKLGCAVQFDSSGRFILYGYPWGNDRYDYRWYHRSSWEAEFLAQWTDKFRTDLDAVNYPDEGFLWGRIRAKYSLSGNPGFAMMNGGLWRAGAEYVYEGNNQRMLNSDRFFPRYGLLLDYFKKYEKSYWYVTLSAGVGSGWFVTPDRTVRGKQSRTYILLEAGCGFDAFKEFIVGKYTFDRWMKVRQKVSR